MNSKEYDAFVEGISSYRKLKCPQFYAKVADLLEKYDKIEAHVIAMPFIVGCASIVAFLVSLVFSFGTFSKFALIVGGIMIAVAISGLWFDAKVVKEGNNKFVGKRNVNEGDKYITTGEMPDSMLVAGYKYYVGMKKGVTVAEERLEGLLQIPEFLEYLNQNDFAYDYTPSSTHEKSIHEYRRYITEQMGDKLKKSENYELFSVPNTKMFENIILRRLYEETGDSYFAFVCQKKSYSDLYELAEMYYDRWCHGDRKSKEEFEKIYQHPDVIKIYLEKRTQKKETTKDMHICFPVSGIEKIISTVIEQDAN